LLPCGLAIDQRIRANPLLRVPCAACPRAADLPRVENHARVVLERVLMRRIERPCVEALLVIVVMNNIYIAFVQTVMSSVILFQALTIDEIRGNVIPRRTVVVVETLRATVVRDDEVLLDVAQRGVVCWFVGAMRDVREEGLCKKTERGGGEEGREREAVRAQRERCVHNVVCVHAPT
jgi:hypothetical protein